MGNDGTKLQLRNEHEATMKMIVDQHNKALQHILEMEEAYFEKLSKLKIDYFALEKGNLNDLKNKSEMIPKAKCHSEKLTTIK
jgi:hypothetical protein